MKLGRSGYVNQPAKCCVLAAVAALPAILCGCRVEPPSPAESLRKERDALFGSQDRPPKPTSPGQMRRGMVQLHMTSIELPFGAASGSDEIWQALDEQVLDPQKRKWLALNGMRVGLGKQKNWEVPARILRRLHGRKLKTGVTTFPPGRTVPVVLERRPEGQTVFLFRTDGSAIGTDVPPGDTLLAVGGHMEPERPGHVRVSFAPQTRKLRQKRKFVRGPEGFTLSHDDEITSFHSLEWELALSEADFILVGPGKASARATSPGHYFFVHESKGVRYETLLLISPRTVKPAPPAKPGSAAPSEK